MEAEKKLLREFDLEVYENEFIIRPAGGHEKTIIWIPHATRAAVDIGPFFTKGAALKLEKVRYVIPQAPTRVLTADEIKTPTPSWFDVLARDFNKPVEEVINVSHLKESVAVIEKLIEREVKLLGGNGKKLFIGGFAQGTGMALAAALQSKHKLGGVFCAHGYFLSVTEVNEANKDTPVLVVLGKRPPFRPWDKPDGMYMGFEKTFDELKKKKSENTTIEVLDGDAYYDQEPVQQLLIDFLKKHE